MSSPKVTVIVTVLNDRRVERTLRSLSQQTLHPLEVLVADGGSTDGTFELAGEIAKTDPTIIPRKYPGSIAQSRNQAIADSRGEIIAFLDADEVAPETWLKALIAPFEDEKVGFTAGPTPGLPGTTSTVGASYYDAYLRRFYEKVASRHPHALPMGNSAWRAALFAKLGKLDTTLYPRAASEDQEFALRVLKDGWKGVYARDAWVHHDFSDMTLPRLLKKQAMYATGGYVVWRREGSTYEASGLRLLPYILPPGLMVLGLVLLPFFWRQPVVPGAVLALSVISLTALFVGLLVDGLLGDREYPGWRFRPVEILRRWATLYGAVRGFWGYGLRGRSEETAAEPDGHE